MVERRLFDISAENYMDLGQRVAIVETNQKSLATSLKETVDELKKITITLAERRGAERISMLVSGSFLTCFGGVLTFLIQHFFK